VTITTYRALTETADGERVEIEGRYETFRDFPPPPGPPRTVKVMLDGGGVLIGRYQDPESVRPLDEIDRHDGGRVRIAGRYYRTRAWPHPGPPPGIWHGGGSQLVDVEPPSLVGPPPARRTHHDEAIEIRRVRPERPPPAPLPPDVPILPPRIAPRIPDHVGALARRSLAHGVSRLPDVGIALLALALGGAVFAIEYALGVRDSTYIMILPFVVVAAAFFGLDALAIRRRSERELRRLAALPLGLDLGAYVAMLDRSHAIAQLRVECWLVEPVDPDRRAALLPPLPRGMDAVWSSRWSVVLECPSVGTTEMSHPRFGTGRDNNAGLHRWFRRCLVILLALHQRVPIHQIDPKTR
jgi:hypothetical protein